LTSCSFLILLLLADGVDSVHIDRMRRAVDTPEKAESGYNEGVVSVLRFLDHQIRLAVKVMISASSLI
jgi:hypothetical protein